MPEHFAFFDLQISHARVTFRFCRGSSEDTDVRFLDSSGCGRDIVAPGVRDGDPSPSMIVEAGFRCEEDERRDGNLRTGRILGMAPEWF